MSSPIYGHERPQIIVDLREQLRELGWTIDPRNQAGHPYGHNIHIEGPNWNITGTYRWPHPPALHYDACGRLIARGLLCRGAGHMGLLIRENAVTDLIRFESDPLPPNEWLRLAVKMFEDLRAYARSKE